LTARGAKAGHLDRRRTLERVRQHCFADARLAE
jgi:hypothetical protein